MSELMITHEWLVKEGVLFEDPSDESSFLKTIQDHLDLRIGRAISNKLSGEALQEFGLLIDDPEFDDPQMYKWLTDNFPDFQDVVENENETIRRELLNNRARIPGLLWPECALKDSVRTLPLSTASKRYLEEEAIDTVGDLLTTPVREISAISETHPDFELLAAGRLIGKYKKSRILIAAGQMSEACGYEAVRARHEQMLEAERALHARLKDGTRIFHKTYGEGRITGRDLGKISVKFDSVKNTKRFDLMLSGCRRFLSFPDPDIWNAVDAYAAYYKHRYEILLDLDTACRYLGPYRKFLEEN